MKLLIIFSLLLFGCAKKITEKQCEDKAKLQVENALLRIKNDSVKVEYKLKDTVIYHPGSTIEKTLWLDKPVPYPQYIVDKSGTTALKIEYDSLLHKYRVLCETLERVDSLKIKETVKTIHSTYIPPTQEPKESNNVALWVAMIFSMLLSLGVVGFNLYRQTRV